MKLLQGADNYQTYPSNAVLDCTKVLSHPIAKKELVRNIKCANLKLQNIILVKLIQGVGNLSVIDELSFLLGQCKKCHTDMLA